MEHSKLKCTFARNMKKGKLRSLFIGGLLTVFVPAIAYLYLKSNGYNGRIPLPHHYGVEKVVTITKDGKPFLDTVYRTLADIKLMNQLGDSVWLNKDLQGKILVMNFFFSSCQTICPVLTKNMHMLTKALKKCDTAMQFISISVDPEHDSMLPLRKYANKYDVNHDKWFFMAGKKETVYDYARTQLELKVPAKRDGENDFIHPEQFILVDKYRNIRGYYNGLDSDKVRLVAEDITYLLVEKNTEHEQ
jgi:protein SCO1